MTKITATNDGFNMVAGEGSRLKREQLFDEINRLKDSTERANLIHSYYKLFSFLEEDIRMALREAARNPYKEK